MYYKKIGKLYELKAPGFVIRAPSTEQCFDTLMICMINKVPADSFNPTHITVSNQQEFRIAVAQGDTTTEADIERLNTLGLKVKDLCSQLVEQSLIQEAPAQH
jgi:hypothetical protein